MTLPLEGLSLSEVSPHVKHRRRGREGPFQVEVSPERETRPPDTKDPRRSTLHSIAPRSSRPRRIDPWGEPLVEPSPADPLPSRANHNVAATSSTATRALPHYRATAPPSCMSANMAKADSIDL